MDTSGDRPVLYSLLGLGASKRWDGITYRTFRLSLGEDSWSELPMIDSPGRIAATAQIVMGRLYLFGGYTVDADGTEKSEPNTDIYDPVSHTWSHGEPIPVPVDDAVSVVWQDSLIYLVSGWHDFDNIQLVQVYDPVADQWYQATPIPGPGLFGHTGAIAGNTIVFVDGVRTNRQRPRYAIEARSWRGDIDPDDPLSINWHEIESHPGNPVYRGAGGSCDKYVIIAGGTDNPYNFDGLGYDGVPSSPSAAVVAYSVTADRWERWTDLEVASMDHRALPILEGRGFLIGGMREGQDVTDTAYHVVLHGSGGTCVAPTDGSTQ